MKSEEELRAKIKALKRPDPVHAKYLIEAELDDLVEIISTHTTLAVKEARLQDKANIFVRFKQAMMLQDLSARPPKDARFRTPLEELSAILEALNNKGPGGSDENS